jgi:hypothetical protein
MEGNMAEEFPNRSERLLNIDRRQLLSTAVGITAAGIVPNLNSSETDAVVSAQTVSTASEPILKVCANTSRRLSEIGRRNQLRREAKLPLLSVAREIRRMKETDDRQKFWEVFGPFAEKHRQAVWDEVLKPRCELEAPNWRPNWIEGMAYQGEVFRVLRERFEAERQRG